METERPNTLFGPRVRCFVVPSEPHPSPARVDRKVGRWDTTNRPKWYVICDARALERSSTSVVVLIELKPSIYPLAGVCMRWTRVPAVICAIVMGGDDGFADIFLPQGARALWWEVGPIAISTRYASEVLIVKMAQEFLRTEYGTERTRESVPCPRIDQLCACLCCRTNATSERAREPSAINSMFVF